MEVIFFESASGFRQWLEENHEQASELLIGFYKVSSGKTGITYAQALETSTHMMGAHPNF